MEETGKTKKPSSNEAMEKEAKIKREISRLRGVFRDLDKNKLKTVESLIRTAAFMAVSLEELEAIINSEGYSAEYQNGKDQSGTKETPEVKIHLAMTKNHALVMRQLADLAPPARKKKSALQRMRDGDD